jgi:isopentenyl-diphosphate delta-isomerase
MGLNCQLTHVGSFVYRQEVSGGLIEYEFDHLLIGHSDLDPTLNLQEAVGWKRVALDALRKEVSDQPNGFTCWLRIIIDTQLHHFPSNLLAGQVEQ